MHCSESLFQKVRQCTLCASELPLGPRPVFQAHRDARILVAGQAPGRIVHRTGVPFDDASGQRLRQWMGVNREIFYDPRRVAILPMGLCYPGTGKSGDRPPVRRCATHWREPLLSALGGIKLTIVLGRFALQWHVPEFDGNVTDTVRRGTGLKNLVALPHPSPRNNLWLKRNPWFEKTVVPDLRNRVAALLNA